MAEMFADRILICILLNEIFQFWYNLIDIPSLEPNL